MAQIQGVIQHYGTNKVGARRVTLNAAPSGEVWSVQPDGSLAIRPPGTAGPYEVGVLDGSIFTARPVDTPLSFVVTDITGL